MVNPGDHVVSTTVEHNSVIRPLNHLQRDGVITVDYVPTDSNGRVDPDDIVKHLRPETKLVVVNHGSNVIGTIQPVAEIGRLCHERGIRFVVDTAQTAGVVPIDVQQMNIDALAFTGHKSLLAPTGIGGSSPSGTAAGSYVPQVASKMVGGRFPEPSGSGLSGSVLNSGQT